MESRQQGFFLSKMGGKCGICYPKMGRWFEHKEIIFYTV
jgi:hypothetical protein